MANTLWATEDKKKGKAGTKPKKNVSRKPKGYKSELPPWKVILHNDDVNTFNYVVRVLVELCKMNERDAIKKTKEADKHGLSTVLVTHKERAELYKDQFTSKGLTVTIEADK